MILSQPPAKAPGAPDVALAALRKQTLEIVKLTQEVLDAYHRAPTAVEFAEQFSKIAPKLQRFVWDAHHETQEEP